jgi:hypothetical protein
VSRLALMPLRRRLRPGWRQQESPIAFSDRIGCVDQSETESVKSKMF